MVWKDHVHNCAPCHLPNICGKMDPKLEMVLTSFKCVLCRSTCVATTSWYVTNAPHVDIQSALTPPLEMIFLVFLINCTLYFFVCYLE